MKVFFEGAFLALSSCAFTRYFFNIFMSKSIFLLRIFSFKKTRENAAVHKENDRYSFITISLWYLLWCATFSVYFLAFINMCIDLLYLVHLIEHRILKLEKWVCLLYLKLYQVYSSIKNQFWILESRQNGKIVLNKIFVILSFRIRYLIGWTRYYRSGFSRRPQKFDEISWLIWQFKP